MTSSKAEQDNTGIGLHTLVSAAMMWDDEKTALWFDTPNPLLGGVSPNWMLDRGRNDKLGRFIRACLDENSPLAAPTQTVRERDLLNSENVIERVLAQCLHARKCNAPWGQTEKYPSVTALQEALNAYVAPADTYTAKLEADLRRTIKVADKMRNWVDAEYSEGLAAIQEYDTLEHVASPTRPVTSEGDK